METLKSEQIRELKEHQSIPRGGWKLAAGASIALFALLPFFAMWAILLGWLPASLADLPTRIVLGLGAFECLTIAWFAFFASADQWPKSWLKSYWRRNVIGPVARFVFVDKPVSDALGEWPRLQHDIRTRKEDADDRWQTHRTRVACERNVAISFPLGGWFTQSWIRGIDRDQIGRLQGWSVKLRAILHTSAVMVEIRKRNRFWGINERIVTDVGSALRHLEEIATKPGTPASISDYFHWKALSLDVTTRERGELERRMNVLFDVIREAAGNPQTLIHEWEEKELRLIGNPALDEPFCDWMKEQIRRLVAERDAARGEVDRYRDGFLPAAVKDRDEAVGELDGQLRSAVNFMKTTVVPVFEQSSRLRETLEGLRLLSNVLEWLSRQGDGYMSPEERAHYRAMHAGTTERIAEKQKRDRRRHGKAKAPVPAA